MGAARAIINKLYQRFFLRDLLGKIVPGAVLLLAVLGVRGFKDLGILTFAGVVFVVGISWFTGFALQNAVEWLARCSWWRNRLDRRRLQPYFPGRFNDDQERYEHRLRFLRAANAVQQAQEERGVVLKEATANGGFALILASIAFLYREWIGATEAGEVGYWIPSVGLAVGLILAYASTKFARRQFLYMDLVIRRHERAEN